MSSTNEQTATKELLTGTPVTKADKNDFKSTNLAEGTPAGSSRSANEEQQAAMKEKLVTGTAKKDAGNEAFKNGEIYEALRLYHEALLHLNGLQNNKSFAVFRRDEDKEQKDPLQEEIMKTVSTIYSNMAACLIKNQKWTRAVECCNKALKNDPDNTKALFRRAQAYIQEGNTTCAERDLKKLDEKIPDDVGVKREWQKFKLKEKEQERKQAADLKGLFDRMRAQDEKEEAAKKKQAANESSKPGPSKASSHDDEESRITEIDDDVDNVTDPSGSGSKD